MSAFPVLSLSRIASVSFALLCIGMVGCGQSTATIDSAETENAAAESDSAANPVGTVKVVVDIPEGESHVEEIAIEEGATVETVMQDCSLETAIRGSGETAFMASINGHGTEAGKGWIFKVDGEFASQGMGATVVPPGSEIHWLYGTSADLNAE